MDDHEFKVGDVVYTEGSSALLGDVIRVEDDEVEVRWRQAYSTEVAEDLILAPVEELTPEQRIRKLKEEDYQSRGDVSEDAHYARTILDRAQNGRDMAALAATGSSYLAYEDYETGLVDALANLLHFARRYEIDFTEAYDTAYRHFAAERTVAWDEVPQ